MVRQAAFVQLRQADALILLAEPIVLVMNADGTLSGCTPNQRSFVTLWTVPGEQVQEWYSTQHDR